ncbi:hypothetical protein [Dactylosporangium sp. NPDC051541]|uniref:hypothetical protein n=1 Tax=Dactylosporangium sp. NPDC051541 TaxID=3363977 RepID=UPI0037A03BDF
MDDPGTDLAGLEEQARRSGDPADWHRYARALAAESPGAALRVVRGFYGTAADPDPAVLDHLALSVEIAAAAGLVAYAEYQLRLMVGLATDDATTATIQRNLATLHNWRHDRDRQRQFRRLQLDYFAERAAHGRHGPEHYLPLAQATLEAGAADKFGSRLGAAVAVLDAALEVNPQDERLLETLVHLLTDLRAEDRLDAALHRLERVNPRSVLVREFAAAAPPLPADDRPGTASFELSEFLVELAGSPDSGEVEAALAELRARVEEFPRSPSARAMLGCGLLNAGQHEACGRELELIEELAPGGHWARSLAELAGRRA